MSRREWMEPQPVVVPDDLRALAGHPLVAEALVRRGLTTAEAARAFLDPDHYRPASPFDLPQMTLAVERLEQAIQGGEQVCVWGDYDVDGETAATLLYSVLRDLGGQAQYHIPHRQREPRGLNLPTLERLAAEGVTLVLTCDTGVGEHAAIGQARALGIEVVVTDHHNLPPTLPPACAVVNPRMLPEGHPLRELPGVGCAYQVALALLSRAGRAEEADALLDLVALGVVGDVAMLVGDNRYLLQRGLAVLRRTPRLGLQAMIEAAGLRADHLTEEHIGYVLAPRLNALARLADAAQAVEFLLTDDPIRARILAAEMESLNVQRRLLSEQVAQAAQAQVERDPALLDRAVLLLSHPAWPTEVLGIAAHRLAEQYGRPAVLIAAPPGQVGRGSARSVEGVNITAALAAHADLLEGFGGHTLAAGFTILPERIPDLRHALSRTVQQMAGQERSHLPLRLDGYLSLSDLTLDLVESLERLAPFGPGNPPMTLATRNLTLVGDSGAGRNGEHRRLLVRDEQGITQRVIWWRGAGRPLPSDRFDLAYTVRAADYRGERQVQVEWVDARPCEGPAVRLSARPPVAVEDLRSVPDARQALDRLRAREEVLVWAEAAAREEVAGCDRFGLRPAPVLAIWTIPPGPAELRQALEHVSPARVYLFAVDPGLDDPETFLRRLAGLVRYGLRTAGGRMRLSALAAAMAHRQETVRVGLDWLAARGHVALLETAEDEVQVARGDGQEREGLPRLTARLVALLEETAAYRAYFTRASSDSILNGL